VIGQTAPVWRAKACLNNNEVALSSEDYVGKWHVLYFYPLDFTVCPTKIVGFQKLSDAFAEEPQESFVRNAGQSPHRTIN
jgi:peroxiredoxin (alkyl hydroperoxide reductase subunit C)